MQKCHLLGSNQGPSDLQSDALPTELKRLVCTVFDESKNLLEGFEPPTSELESDVLNHYTTGGYSTDCIAIKRTTPAIPAWSPTAVLSRPNDA